MIQRKKYNNLSQYIHHYAKTVPNQLAIIYEDMDVSYKSLNTLTIKFANLLFTYKIKTVAFCILNSPINFLCYLGSWASNTDAFPINPRLTNHEIIKILKKTKLELLIVDDERPDENLKKFCQESNIILVTIDKLNPMKGDLANKLKDIEESPIFENSPKNNCSFTYHLTSGSDGKYKLIAHNNLQILEYAINRAHDIGYTKEDKILISLSIHHAFAFSYQFLPALILGLPMYVQSQFCASEALKIIYKNKITSIALLPSMVYFLCLKTKEFSYRQYPSLRYAISCGDSLPIAFSKLFKKVFNSNVYQGIGMTEVFGYAQNTPNSKQMLSTGKLFNTVQIKILNDSGELVDHGTPGNVYIKNEVMPNRTHPQSEFPVHQLENGWLNTEDIGYIDNLNYFYFLGRKKHIIIKDGSNISPIEIENIIYLSDRIYQVAVLGQKHEIHGEIIIAFIVPMQNSFVDLTFIKQHCKKYLANYKIPEKVYIVDSLPLNSTGKIDKKSLHSLLVNKNYFLFR